MLRQIIISGELDFVVLGVFYHVVFIYHHEAGEELPPISYDHRIIYINTRL